MELETRHMNILIYADSDHGENTLQKFMKDNAIRIMGYTKAIQTEKRANIQSNTRAFIVIRMSKNIN
jgi:hypothetical protein